MGLYLLGANKVTIFEEELSSGSTVTWAVKYVDFKPLKEPIWMDGILYFLLRAAVINNVFPPVAIIKSKSFKFSG